MAFMLSENADFLRSHYISSHSICLLYEQMSHTLSSEDPIDQEGKGTNSTYTSLCFHSTYTCCTVLLWVLSNKAHKTNLSSSLQNSRCLPFFSSPSTPHFFPTSYTPLLQERKMSRWLRAHCVAGWGMTYGISFRAHRNPSSRDHQSALWAEQTHNRRISISPKTPNLWVVQLGCGPRFVWL